MSILLNIYIFTKEDKHFEYDLGKTTENLAVKKVCGVCVHV